MDDRVYNYIKGMLSDGYTKSQITSALVKGGYKVVNIERYFKEIQPTHFLFSIKTIFIIILLLILISAGVALYYGNSFAQSNPKKARVVIENIKLTNESLYFSIELSPKQNKRLIVNYELMDNLGNKLLIGKETLTVNRIAPAVITVPIEEDIGKGEYTLNINGILDGKKFSVTKLTTFQPEHTTQLTKPEINKPSCDDKIKNGDETGIDCGGNCNPCFRCDDNNPCTIDYSDKDGCIHQQSIPCCGNSICESEENTESCDIDCIDIEKPLSRDEIIKIVNDALPEFPAKAITYCKQLVFVSDRDACYENIAGSTKESRFCLSIDSTNRKDTCFLQIANYTQQSALCGSIITNSIKDSCYVQFIVQGDYSLCNSLSDDYLKKSCDLLRG